VQTGEQEKATATEQATALDIKNPNFISFFRLDIHNKTYYY